MSKCDVCEKESETKYCLISDNMGKRYRNLCDECIISMSDSSKIKIINYNDSTIQNKPTEMNTATNIDLKESINNLIITTGFNVENHHILKYIDIIFIEQFSGIGIKTSLKSLGDIFASLTGDELYAMNNRIHELKTQLIQSMKLKAIKMGANAIIGVDFETTFAGGSAIMVSANGTAVIIE